MGLRAVAIGDQFALPFGVVIDVGHERRSGRRAAQVHIHLVEQIGFVVGRAIDAVVRRGDGSGAG